MVLKLVFNDHRAYMTLLGNLFDCEPILGHVDDDFCRSKQFSSKCTANGLTIGLCICHR